MTIRMKWWWLLLIPIMAGLAVAFAWYDPSARAWKEALRMDSMQGYQAFLAKFPQRKHDAEIPVTLQAAVDQAAQADSAGLVRAFIKRHSTSTHIVEAQRRLAKLTIRATCERYHEQRAKETAAPTADEICALAVGSLSTRPETPAAYRNAIDFWAMFFSAPDADLWRASFSDIQPDGNAPALWIGESSIDSGANVSGTITSKDGSSTLTLKGLFFQKGGRLDQAVGLTTGSYPFAGPKRDRSNFAANIAIGTGGDDTLLAVAELPNEWVFMLNVLGLEGTATRLLIPNSAGTVVRFKGDVKGFFEHYTFHGSETYPLAFALLKDYGLTYLCGEGMVTDDSGKQWQFPAQAKHL